MHDDDVGPADDNSDQHDEKGVEEPSMLDSLDRRVLILENLAASIKGGMWTGVVLMGVIGGMLGYLGLNLTGEIRTLETAVRAIPRTASVVPISGVGPTAVVAYGSNLFLFSPRRVTQVVRVRETSSETASILATQFCVGFQGNLFDSRADFSCVVEAADQGQIQSFLAAWSERGEVSTVLGFSPVGTTTEAVRQEVVDELAANPERYKPAI